MTAAVGSQLLPINLQRLGLARRGDGMFQRPDLVTIMLHDYPVLSNYVVWCRLAGLEPFAGRNYEVQGPPDVPGYILSGYRDKQIGANRLSPHFYAFAIDAAVGDADAQIKAAPHALGLFTRVGLYPFRGFIHLDQAPDNWIERYKKHRFWFQDQNRKYVYFDTLDETIAQVKVACDNL